MAINKTHLPKQEHPRLISLYRMKALDIQRKIDFPPFFSSTLSSTEEKSAAEISFCEKLCFFSSLFSFAPFFSCLFFGEERAMELRWRAFETDGNVTPISPFAAWDFRMFIFVVAENLFALCFDDEIDKICEFSVYLHERVSLEIVLKSFSASLMRTLSLRKRWKFEKTASVQRNWRTTINQIKNEKLSFHCAINFQENPNEVKFMTIQLNFNWKFLNPPRDEDNLSPIQF